MTNNVFKGNLDIDLETGRDGVEWILIDENNKTSRDGIIKIETGDHLKIISCENQIIFDSIIVRTNKSNRYGLDTLVGTQQVAGGYYCSFLQHGVDPDFWAFIFESKYYATLTKNVYSDDDIQAYLNKTNCTDEKIPLPRKVFNQFFIELKDKQKLKGFNHFTEIEESEFFENDDDYYNAQLFFLRVKSSLLYSKENDYVWLFSQDELKGFKEPEYKIDSFPKKEDFEFFMNEFHTKPVHFSEFLSKELKTKFDNKEMYSGNEVDQILAASLKAREEQAHLFNELQKMARTFSFKHQGKYYHGCLVKFK